MAKIHQRSLSTIMPQEKDRDSVDPRSQTLLSEDSICMVDPLEIPRVVDCFFFFGYYTIDLRWLCHNMSFVFSSRRENQINVTIGTLLHHIHDEF